MLDFFGNIFYLLPLGLILIITYIVANNSFSAPILSKHPNALIWNNSLIISGIILIIATFFVFSWVAGIITIVLAFVVYILAGRKIMKDIKNNIFNSVKKGR